MTIKIQKVITVFDDKTKKPIHDASIHSMASQLYHNVADEFDSYLDESIDKLYSQTCVYGDDLTRCSVREFFGRMTDVYLELTSRNSDICESDGIRVVVNHAESTWCIINDKPAELVFLYVDVYDSETMTPHVMRESRYYHRP